MKEKIFNCIGKNNFKVKNSITESEDSNPVDHLALKIQVIAAGRDDIESINFGSLMSHQPEIKFRSGKVWPLDWDEFMKFIQMYGQLQGKI